MLRYLLDTNICAFYFRNQFKIADKLVEVGLSKCAISEITLAELKFGIERSKYREENSAKLDLFTEFVTTIPLTFSISLFAKEKARLISENKIIDDFDLFIGTTAVIHNLIMVTENIDHFSRINNILIENWAVR